MLTQQTPEIQSGRARPKPVLVTSTHPTWDDNTICLPILLVKTTTQRRLQPHQKRNQRAAIQDVPQVAVQLTLNPRGARNPSATFVPPSISATRKVAMTEP